MKTYRRIGAISLTFDILHHLADQQEPVSGADIARALEAPVATIMCHLVTLADKRIVRNIGGAWELDMGLALFWARKKANLEGTIDRARQQLNQLEV